MSFISKLWKDRVSDYPNKRKLTKEDGTSETVTVERAEGDIVVAGDAFNAENMNDLETRIQNGFNAVERAQAELNENFVKLDENMQNRFKIMKFQLPPDTTANTKVYTATESDLMDYFPVGISAYVQSDTDAFWINNAEHIQQVLLRADGIYITLKSTYLVNQWARLLLCRYPT